MSKYRFFEILPGGLAWLTIFLMFFLSWKTPTFISVFIILFDIYWLLKTVYLSLHLRATFGEMKKNLKVEWFSKLQELERNPKDPNFTRMPQIVEKDLSYTLTGIFFDVQKTLGRYARERQYGDALAVEFEKHKLQFTREQAVEVGGRKSSFVDFVIEGRIAVELKTKPFVQKEDYYQVQRYLKSTGLELGLIVNFSQPVLKPKRVLNAELYSGHSDVFVDWGRIYHLVILPMYKEPYEVVRESFERLVETNYPKDKFIVVLAVEERAGEEAVRTAAKIESELGRKFYRFLITRHPQGRPDEIPGKGSNEAWAAGRVKEDVIDPLGLDYKNILVSVFDVDTQVPKEFFSRLTYVFLTAANPLRAIYQPVPLFVNNIYQAPALARVVAFSSTFWQMMQQSRPERLTSFSSQSIPLQTLVDIGFWHKDIVSEDSRIFWQCYLHYHGDFRVEPLLYPVSMDANVAPTFWETMKNVYRQQRRWGWGAENIPYLMCGRRTIEANTREKKVREISQKDSHGFAPNEGFLYDSRIPRWKKWYWSFNVIEGFHSWATNSLMIFLLGWLPLFLGGRNFGYTLLSYSLPQITRFVMSLAMVGIASSAVISILLLPTRPAWFKVRHYSFYFLQWVFMPITLIVFGALPGLESQTRLMVGGKLRLGFWVTPKHRK